MNLNIFAVSVIASSLLGVVMGLFIGHSLYYKLVVKETPAFAVKQPDRSLILSRDPDAKAKPAHQIPKGATVERVVKVIVRAKPVAPAEAPSASEPIAVAADCPPVNLDLSLVRMPDETRRVIVSSQNGYVLDGIDIPVESAKPVSDAKKWAIGGVYYSNEAYSARVERDFGPTRVSVEAMKVGSDIVAGVGLGIRF